MMNKINIVFILSLLLILLPYGVLARLGGPELDPGPGGGSRPAHEQSKTIQDNSINNVFDFLFNSGEDTNITPVPQQPVITPQIPEVTIPFPNENTPIESSAALRQALGNLKDTITYSNEIINAVRNCQQNRLIYEQATRTTGVAPEILAGIHFVEGSCNPNQSLVSGRRIGVVEPDVGRNCSEQINELGKPIVIEGGCGFTSLLSSAIYGANHLKGKIGKSPETFEEYAKALGRYNGIGNRNCGKTPYPHCPPSFDNDDHIYPMSKLDKKHQNMYLVYCADHTVCNPPRPFNRIGVLTVAYILMYVIPGR